MIKALKIFQYAYLVIAIVLIYEAFSNWSEDRSKSYFLIFFAALAIFMFFFRKNFRKRIEDRHKK